MSIQTNSKIIKGDAPKPVTPVTPVTPVNPVVPIIPNGKLLGPRSGKFFLIGLDKKPSYKGLVYYTTLLLGTESKTSGVHYDGPNKPLNITYVNSSKVS